MMRRVGWIWALISLACGAQPGGGASEPTLAEAAVPITLDSAIDGELLPPCDRLVFAFSPDATGSYHFVAGAEVPLQLRLFSMSPDLYIGAGTRSGGESRVTAELEAGMRYAVTVGASECRATGYTLVVARE